MTKMRVGMGYDVHQLKEGEPFWLGGIRIEHTHGATGHSDADVLIHVICDALLGAANLRDIGYHFSDQDPQYRGIDSKILLQRTMELIRGAGWEVGNVDATVCLQRPKINPHVPAMKVQLAETMAIAADDLSIKATTTERLGFVGREEGVSAYAVVLLTKTGRREQAVIFPATTA
ncbi:MAG: 2-C-methyl-D-erythritol 2,4-cyclodiphosphate synthase [Catalinimonas sp.]